LKDRGGKKERKKEGGKKTRQSNRRTMSLREHETKKGEEDKKR
jgi:hypothetical protein